MTLLISENRQEFTYTPAAAYSFLMGVVPGNWPMWHYQQNWLYLGQGRY